MLGDARWIVGDWGGGGYDPGGEIVRRRVGMRIWPRLRRAQPPEVDVVRSDGPAVERPPEEPTTEQLLEAGPALDWGGDPSRITG